ncbi:hypothetical protein MLD38_016231 [Melastoma candidum]|uniref:Uncharacterized protein n=2 Tax=Melastoma candidum TaxID=119954 RepID=A0ACB9RJC4_9MYRT|nr:hypothetical protein MLD38_016231 [Melastoma candidum]
MELEKKMCCKDGHILLLPFMAHGHLIPFLALARRLASRSASLGLDLGITVAATPLNVCYLRSTMDPTSSVDSLVDLLNLPFSPCDHGLPPAAENTENLPLDSIIRLFHSSASLRPHVESFLSEVVSQGTPPDRICIIADVFLGWSAEVAWKFGATGLGFSTGGSYGTLAYVSLWLHLPHRQTNEDEFYVPGFPNHYRFHRSQLHRFMRAADGEDPWAKFFQGQIKLSMGFHGWLCNSAEEIEPLGFDLLRKYLRLPVWGIGPLLPSAFLSLEQGSGSAGGKHAGKQPGLPAERCLEWLSSHQADSVLYISFGSQNTITQQEMMELARGLEASGKPFLWVIRPPVGFNARHEFQSEWLPEGFEERATASSLGLLVRNWGPQLEILSHESTGAFLSHCGWNSTVESLSQGVPIIGWSMAAEQAYNTKMLVEEMGVCVELARGVGSGEVDAEKVRRVVDEVMDQEGKGREMRRRAKEVGWQIRAAVTVGKKGEKDGSSVLALDQVLKLVVQEQKWAHNNC